MALRRSWALGPKPRRLFAHLVLSKVTSWTESPPYCSSLLTGRCQLAGRPTRRGLGSARCRRFAAPNPPERGGAPAEARKRRKRGRPWGTGRAAASGARRCTPAAGAVRGAPTRAQRPQLGNICGDISTHAHGPTRAPMPQLGNISWDTSSKDSPARLRVLTAALPRKTAPLASIRVRLQALRTRCHSNTPDPPAAPPPPKRGLPPETYRSHHSDAT